MSSEGQGEITEILRQIEAGDASARERLIELVQQDLREVAQRLMRHERPDHTLQPTALVNEAVIKLHDAALLHQGRNRAYFFGAMTRAMRRVLVDHAKMRHAQRRGGGEIQRVALDLALENVENQHHVKMLDLEEALEELQQMNSRQCEVIQLRFFGGLTVPEIAEQLEVSISTIEKDWRLARAWLHHRLAGSTQ